MSTKETPISMRQKKYPPRAEVRPYKYEKFGITVEDNYAWLKDDNWQLVVKNPVKLSSDIRNYLESENEYLATEMEHTKKFQELLFSEMKNRVKEDDQGNTQFSVVTRMKQPMKKYCLIVTWRQISTHILK